MAKILLISDTHGYTKSMDILLRKHQSEVSFVCHMGDGVNDVTMFEEQYPNICFVSVAGNMDYKSSKNAEYVFSPISEQSLENLRILIVHGNRLGVKSDLNRLMYYAREKNVQACFFGHTHKQFMQNIDGLFFMNPGSLTYPHDGNGDYGLVTITSSGDFLGELRKI